MELQADVVEAITAAAEEEATAEVAYKVGYSQALLASSQGTVKEREADALLTCKDLLFDYRKAENMNRAMREKLKAYVASIDGLRTILVGFRENT